MTAERLRGWLADTLREDFGRGQESQYAAFFVDAVLGSPQEQADTREQVAATVGSHGYWGDWVGNQIPQVFALAAGLPMTLVGPWAYHLGPHDRSPEHYFVYTGNHYLGAFSRDGRAVATADEARPVTRRVFESLPPRPAPVPEADLARYREVYQAEFRRLRAELEQRLAGLDAAGSQVPAAAAEALGAVRRILGQESAVLTEDSVDALGDEVDLLAERVRELPRPAAPGELPGPGEDDTDSDGDSGTGPAPARPRLRQRQRQRPRLRPRRRQRLRQRRRCRRSRGRPPAVPPCARRAAAGPVASIRPGQHRRPGAGPCCGGRAGAPHATVTRRYGTAGRARRRGSGARGRRTCGVVRQPARRRPRRG